MYKLLWRLWALLTILKIIVQWRRPRRRRTYLRAPDGAVTDSPSERHKSLLKMHIGRFG